MLQTTDRQKTDGRATAYIEREREFTFANYLYKFTITGAYSNLKSKT